MSVVEYVRYHVPEDDCDAFVDTWRAALPLVEHVPGNESFELRRGVEDPTDFLARITWSQLDDHTRFRESDAFAAFKAKLAPFAIESIAHYELVDLT